MISAKEMEDFANYYKGAYENLSAFEIGWLAAAIDSEGTITLSLARPSRRTTRRKWHLKPMLSFSNTSAEFCDRFSHLLGAGALVSKKARTASRRPSWTVSLYRTNDLDEILSLVEPHLLVKREQAGLVREFIHMRQFALRNRHLDGQYQQYVPYTPREQEIYRQIASLNRFKGKRRTDPQEIRE